MRRRHPSIVFLHWSRKAYQETGPSRPHPDEIEDLDEEEEQGSAAYSSTPLYPLIKLRGPRRWSQESFFRPRRNSAGVPQFDCIETTGPVSDEVVPIIFGFDHGGVYLRDDVAGYLRPHFSPTQCLLPVLCDDEMIPYLALGDAAPRVWLPDNRQCSEEELEELEKRFHDGQTDYWPVYPDAFDPSHGVHFVGGRGNLFLDLKVWQNLRAAVPAVGHWLNASRIVVDDAMAS